MEHRVEKLEYSNLDVQREPHLILGLVAEGSFQYSVKYANDAKDSLKLSLEGELKANVEVVSKQGLYTKVSAKGKGTIISVSGYAIVTKNDVIKEFQFAGQPLIIKYNVGVRDGKAFNQIKISSSLGLTTFGNNGTDTEKNGTWSGKTRIFNFRCPREPNLILGLIAEGSLQYSVKYATDSKDSLKISLEGNLKARVEVVSNQGRYTQVHAKT